MKIVKCKMNWAFSEGDTKVVERDARAVEEGEMSAHKPRRQGIGIVLTSMLVMAVTPVVFVGGCEFVYDGFSRETAFGWLTMLWYLLPYTIPGALFFAWLAQWVYRTQNLSFIGNQLVLLFSGLLFCGLISFIFPVYENADRVNAMLVAGVEVSILAGSIITYAMNTRNRRQQEKTDMPEHIASIE
ncbi:MAG: hypothetical protein ACYDCO_21360 [Armatimonadota bacterium]